MNIWRKLKKMCFRKQKVFELKRMPVGIERYSDGDWAARHGRPDALVKDLEASARKGGAS